MHTRTTLNIDGEPIELARPVAGLTDITALFHAAPAALIPRLTSADGQEYLTGRAPILASEATLTPSAKEEIRKILEALPDDASQEDIQYSIYVRERVERGQREAIEGRLLDEDEVARRMDRWLSA